MKKRLLAGLLALLMIITGPVMEIQANVQIPVESVSVDEVYYVLGEDIITGEPVIRPTMIVSWKDPDQWAPSADPLLVHDPDYYDVVVYNRTKNTTNTIRVNKGTTEFTQKTIRIHEKINLDAGSFYEVEVRPYHYHLNADGTTLSLAPISGTPENAYAITDLNVNFETDESSIQVIWDDLGYEDFRYRIVYAIGDYSSKTKQELINNKEGEITGLRSSSDRVTRFYDPITRRYKLAYTITERVYPGQVYSVMVEPMVDTYNAEPVMRNRNFPVIRTCSTNVQLDIYEEGDYLRLEWDIPPSFKVGQNQEEYELVEATLMQFRDGLSSNIAIFDKNAANIGYYKIPKPIAETGYQIKFLYRAVDNNSKPPIEPISNLAVYVPSELMITPTKPVVPSLMSQQILDALRSSTLTDAQIRDILHKQYFMPGYPYPGNIISQTIVDKLRAVGLSDTQISYILEGQFFVPNYYYTGNLSSLLTQNNNYHILNNSQGINFVWSAFQRIDVDTTSPTYGSYIYDDNVYYDIWVTESMEALGYAPKVIEDERYGTNKPSKRISDGTNTYGYNEVLTSYYNDLTGELTSITPGKIYYIKVVAKKKTSRGDLISQPTIVALYYGYNGDAYAPPTIVKPPLEVKDADDKSVTLTWEEAWWEVIAKAPTQDSPLIELETWRHEVWVDTSGTVYSKKPTNIATEYFPIYKSEDVIEDFLEYLEDVGVSDTLINSISRREVDLGKDAFGVSDVKYKFHRIPYATVLSEIQAAKALNPDYDFEDYYDALIAADKNGIKPINWINISPIVDPENDEKLLYTEQGLLSNTSYLFMVYPYRELQNGELLYAHYPTPIVVSTEPEEVVVNPDPTVPNLYWSDPTDTAITLSWKYNKDFNYEIVYSLFEDVTTAKPLTWSFPTDVTDPYYPIDGQFCKLIVGDLFPNTEYYFWIRAIQPATNKTSHWSNPVLAKTRDVNNPLPPRGFGIASLENMKKYNYDAAVTNEYITVEWILDPEDVPQANDKAVKKTYAYIVEVSDNSGFIDPIRIISSGGSGDVKPSNVEILQKNLIKINELVPNRHYYIRVKTRVTVTGKENGQLIVKESINYSPTIKITTSSTSDEYDGTIDPDLEILPSEDYEIIYDKDTKELTFRFRDNGESSDGTKDNNVDQRLISNLIAQNVYVYNVNIANYENKTINKRSVSIPYSIIEAFDTYKVSLHINAGDTILELPYGALTSEIKQQASQLGGAPSIKIEIESLGSNYAKEKITGQTVRPVTDSVDVDIYVRNNNKEKALNYTDKKINVQLMTNNKYEQFRVNRIGAVEDDQNKWHAIESTFDSSTGYMSFDTAKLGVYCGYVIEDKGVSSINQAHWSENYRKLVASKYTINGLNYYNPDSAISESRLINVLYSITAGQSTVDLDGYISKNTMTALKNSKIKLNDSSTNTQVTREEAISMFARAYEIMNDDVIVPSTINTNLANNNRSIGSTYKVGMAKAATIGLISSIDQSRPKDPLTYGELFTIWSKLIN